MNVFIVVMMICQPARDIVTDNLRLSDKLLCMEWPLTANLFNSLESCEQARLAAVAGLSKVEMSECRLMGLIKP